MMKLKRYLGYLFISTAVIICIGLVIVAITYRDRFFRNNRLSSQNNNIQSILVNMKGRLIILQRNTPVTIGPGITIVLQQHEYTNDDQLSTIIQLSNTTESSAQSASFSFLKETQPLGTYTVQLVNASIDSVQIVIK